MDSVCSLDASTILLTAMGGSSLWSSETTLRYDPLLTEKLNGQRIRHAFMSDYIFNSSLLKKLSGEQFAKLTTLQSGSCSLSCSKFRWQFSMNAMLSTNWKSQYNNQSSSNWLYSQLLLQLCILLFPSTNELSSVWIPSLADITVLSGRQNNHCLSFYCLVWQQQKK